MTSAASTANAAVPAPGKLEFKDDYTPKEAERVIRNSKGLPVGVKPKMVWTWPKALLWAAIAIVCAIGWAILAVSRGEQISAIWFVVVALCSYAIAYRFYAYYIQIKIMRTDDANATPASLCMTAPTSNVPTVACCSASISPAFPVRARLLVLFWPPKWVICRP